MMKKFQMFAVVAVVSGAMWAFCPWFSGGESGNTCCCEGCVEGCAGLDGDVCKCWTCSDTSCEHDDGCSCPNCVPNK